MSYKKIILQCFKDLIEHYKYSKRQKKRSEIPYIEEEYFIVNSEEQKVLLNKWYPDGVKGKIKFYKSISGRLWERFVTYGGLREMQKNKINPFPKMIKG